MAKTRETLESWAADFLANLKPPTKAELKRRKKSFEKAWASRIDIRPLTTAELVRAVRDEQDEA